MKRSAGMGWIWLALAAAGQVPGAIVGGKNTPIAEVPWQLLYREDLGGGATGNCGAVWIGGRWVLCAAHCVESAVGSPSKVRVHAGITRFNQPNNSNGILAKRLIPFPGPLKLDIALIELSADITSTVAKPIRYGVKADSVAGYMNPGVECMASGWGGINRDGDLPDSLQSIRSKIHSITSTYVRWAGQGGTQLAGSCMGDSGGPLVVKDGGGQWIVVGISSSIQSFCGDPKTPSNYAKLWAAADWIRTTTGISGEPSTPILSLAKGPGPSPATGRFRLERGGHLEILFLDPRGRVALRHAGAYPAGEHALPTRELAPGSYTLQLRGGGVSHRGSIRIAR